MSTAYMILCNARTGSNYLASVLDQHPQIDGHNELFHEGKIFTKDGMIDDADSIAQRDANPIAYLHHMLAQSDTPVAGFKHLLFYNQPLIDDVMTSDLHLILLERRNILAQYSSLMIAHKTAEWTLYHGMKPVEPPKLAWDEDAFEAHRQDYETAYAILHQQIKARTAPTHHVYYTDLFKPETIERIHAFLGVASIPITADDKTPRKQNSTNILHRFTQPETVRAYLQRIQHPEWASEQLS
ncbi:MAG: hypothetical protein AAFV93_20640 [Chloroflexota bacterium]